MGNRRRASAAILAALAVGSAGLACTDQTGTQREQAGQTTGPWPRADFATLEVADSCDAFAERMQREAADRVGPWGLEQFAGLNGGLAFTGDVMFEQFDEVGGAIAQDSAAAPQATARTEGGAPATTMSPAIGGDGEFSETNLQEAGVDEPDLVKTDGNLVVSVLDGVLRVTDLTTPVPTELSSTAVAEGYDHRIFLDGDQVVVVAMGAGVDPNSAGTQVQVIDIGEPSEPTVVAGYALDGQFAAARRIGDQVRIVSTTNPQPIDFAMPAGSNRAAEQRAVQVNQELIEQTEASDWLPAFASMDADGNLGEPEPLVDCTNIGMPVAFAGFGTVVVSTLHIDEGRLDADASVGVVAADATVYASANNLYVATSEWAAPDADAEELTVGGASATGLHQFAIGGTGPASYVASGQVEGRLLNQFAMSEHKGHLRVATTTDGFGGVGFMPMPVPEPMPVDPMPLDSLPVQPLPMEPIPVEPTDPGTGAGAPPLPDTDDEFIDEEFIAPEPMPMPDLSDNAMHVLATDGANLVTVGHVDGMGEGERIYSVRYLGDMGYIVTFRETDPLYTIDLSDPTDPQVLGELKIPGFSTYLHPTEPGRLVGIGQDATETGMVIGLQVSLFDVSDPTDPIQAHKWVLPDAYSSAESEHHAFLWWAANDLLVVPVSEWNTGFDGAVVLQVNDAGIAERGRISHDPSELPTTCNVAGCPGVDEPEPTTTTTDEPGTTSTTEPDTTTTTQPDEPTTTTTTDQPGQQTTTTVEGPTATVADRTETTLGPTRTEPVGPTGQPLDQTSPTVVSEEELLVEPAPGSGRPGVAPPVDPLPPTSFPVPIARSLVVGDTIITISSLGLKVTAIDDLSTRAWLVFR